MARPQQFSEDQALNRAMEAFWDKGFHATSMQDLVDYTGVCRASLYKTFGNKEALYEQALCHYRDEQKAGLQQILESDTPVLDVLKGMFQAKVQEVIRDKRTGCLMVNATSELAGQDEKIRAFLQENEQQIRHWFQQLVERGQAGGEISSSLDAVAMAHYLFTAYQGLTINALTQDDAHELDQVIDMILSSLTGYP